MSETRVLWLSGRLPYPLRSGDALYTAGLLQGAAGAGLTVTALGLPREPTSVADLEAVADVEWVVAGGQGRSSWSSLLSRLPKDAHSLFPPELRLRVEEELRRDWDWIVFDHARTGAALDLVLAGRKGARIAYVAHNVEADVRPAVARDIGSPLVSLPYRYDALKYAYLERRLLRASDTVIAITQEDAIRLRELGGVGIYPVPPAYFGPVVESRRIDAGTPRRLMLIGSFDWVAKQANLARFLAVGAAPLGAAGIAIDIIGSVPGRLADVIEKSYPNVTLHGSLRDPRPVAANARGGLVLDDLGGGMKLKLLDYIFMRIPVFSLTHNLAGLPVGSSGWTFAADDFTGLISSVVASIDDIDELNTRQEQAFSAASAFYNVEQSSRIFRAAFLEATTRDEGAATMALRAR